MISEYLFYFLQSDFVKKQFNREGKGAIMTGLNTGILRSLVVFVPSLVEQQKIVSILSMIDSQIQKQKRHRDSLQDLKKGLMQKLLTGQIRVNVAA
jgi:type I restriction enzyme S subunit